jgi:rod shape-determining protein MreC
VRKFLYFLKKTYLFALFVVLEVAAIDHYAGSTSYTRARMVAAAGRVTGGVQGRLAAVNGYLGLRAENDALVAQIARLNGELAAVRELLPDSITPPDAGWDHIVASVVTNTLTRPRNFLTLDKGAQDGVEREMAVLTPEGSIVGYVMDVRERSSVAISLLNTDFRTSGRIKGRDYLGSVLWTGGDADHATLSEIQKYAELAVGDTVVTDYSSRFPKGVNIGTVEDWEMTNLGYFNVRVRLATRFEALHKVLLVRHRDIAERLEMEEYNAQDAAAAPAATAAAKY